MEFTLIYDQYDCGDQIDHFNHMCYIFKFGSYAIKDYFFFFFFDNNKR